MTAAVELEPIEEFRSPGEYGRFVAWLDRLVEEGRLQEVPVEVPWLGADVFVERWFRPPGGARTWRLIAPDPPFKGTFASVSMQHPSR